LTALQPDSLLQVTCMHKRTFSHIILLLGTFFFLQQPLCAQNDLSSEEALKKEASKAFEDEDYGPALKYYLRLLSSNIKDPVYNYRYGVCLLQASPDKDEAIKYLEKASNDPSLDKEVFFYYGRALQLNYRFNDAINAYTKYKSQISESKAKKMQVDHFIETCKNGKSLLRKISDLQVIDKKNLEEKDFFRSYDLSDIGGRLLVKPDDFRTSYDKKKKENSIIFLSTDKNEIYFSSYGSNDENGKDIYVIKRLPNGEYGKPVSLGYPINTEYDEDYPFLHPNGKVLYFASKGHNSMGGFDIFKSERNDETGAWGKPVNLDFPINTPDDDILFVTDKDEKTAFFASRRSSEKGRIDVYHIALMRKPVDLCVFNGKFIPIQENQGKAAKITVKNVEINEVEAVVKASEATGDYVLNLPNGGKYIVTVETPEGDIQSDVLIIQQQFETVPVRQEISYADTKMHVNSFFGQSNTEDDKFSLATNLLRDKAKMDVNMSRNFDVAPVAEKTDSVKTTDTAAVTALTPPKNLTNDDLVNIANQDAADLEKEAKDARDAADKALVFVNDKNTEVVDLNKQIQETNTALESTTDASEKQRQSSRLDLLQVKENTSEAEAVAANNFYTTLDTEANRKNKEASLSKQYAADLAVAIKSKSKDAMTKLDAQKEALEKLNEIKISPDDAVAAIQKEADTKQKEVDHARNESSQLKDEIQGMENEVINLNHEQGETKNEQLKQGLKGQVDGLKEDIKKKESELVVSDRNLGKLQKEASNLNNQANLVRQMNEKMKSGQMPVSAETIDKDKLHDQISSYHPKDKSTPDGTEPSGTIRDTAKSITETPADVVVKTTVNESVSPVNKTGTTDKTTQAETDTKYSNVLASAGSNSPEPEKEQAKADTYKQWADEIDTHVKNKIQELKNTEDPVRKQQLTEEIATLTQEHQEKQRLADESKSKAEQLKNQDKAIAGSSRPEKQDTAVSTTAVIKSTSSTTPDYVIRYNEKVAASDTASSTAKKEQLKAEIYQDWATAIRQDAAKKKEAMDKSSNLEETNRLREDIDKLNKEADQKEALAKRSIASTKNRQNGADTDPSPAPVYDASYKSQLAASDDLKSPEAKDSAKAKIYQQWVSSLNSDIQERKENLDKITDAKQHKAAQQSIAEREIDLAVKKQEANTLAGIVEKKKSGTVVTSDKGSDKSDQTSVKTEVKKTAEPLDNNTKDGAGEKQGAETQSHFTTPAAIAANEEKQNLEAQAIHLKKQSDTLRAQANRSDGSAREEKLKEADDLLRVSKEKESAALTAAARAAVSEFAAKENKLTQYALQPGDPESPALSKAEALTDVSKAYFEKARKLREHADKNPSQYSKEEDLRQAEESEKIAGESQDKAIALYAAAFPNLRLKETPAITPPVKEQVSASHTDEPIKTNDVLVKTTPKETKTDHAVVTTTTEEKKMVPGVQSTSEKHSSSADTVRTDHALVTSHVEDNKKDSPTVVKKEQPYDTVRTDHALIVSHTTENPVDSAAITSMKSSDDYKKLMTLHAEEDIFVEAAWANHRKADEVQLQAQEYTRQSDLVLHDTLHASDDAAKSAAKEKSKEFEKLAYQSYAKSDSLRTVAREFNQKAASKNKESNNLVADMDSSKRMAIAVLSVKEARVVTPPAEIARTESNPAKEVHPENTHLTPLDVVAPEREKEKAEKEKEKATAAELLRKEHIAALKDKPSGMVSPVTLKASEDFTIAAAEAVPGKIEMDPKLPEGLVFKVQIGAFKHTISGDKFKGVRPLTGETTNKGFIRYTAGLFAKFESADKAKNQIRGIGFNDAFVVAFLNGVRIPINDAMAMAAGKPGNVASLPNKEAGTVGNPDARTVGKTDVTVSPVQTNGVKPVNDAMPASVLSQPKAIAKSTPVGNVQGLFYAVQVGVYANPVSNEKLLGIQPLNTEKMENGNIRYTSGQYTDPAKAEEARRKIVELGVKDAFIVAYKDGKKVSSGGASRSSASPNVPVNESVRESVRTTNPPAETQKQQSENHVPAAAAVVSGKGNDFSRYDDKAVEMVKGDTGVVFKVQIGAFVEQIPIEIANKFILLSKRGVKNFKDENGLTVYTIGSVRTYENAQFLKEEATAKGIPDAFILAYKNGKKISVSEAKGDK
jgi:hypothetical protein